MLSTTLVSLALAGQALSAAVPNQHVKRQDASSSSGASSMMSSASMAPTSASSRASSKASSAAGSASGSASSAAASASSSASPSSALVDALNSYGLTSLASLIEPISGELSDQLKEGNFTIFTPVNEAISNANINTSDSDALRQVLSYHIVPSAYPVDEIPDNGTHVIAPTLEGTPISFYKDTYGTTRLIGQDTSVSTNRTVDNLLLKWIDTVLEVPGTVPQVLNTTAGTTSLADFAGEYLPSMVTSLNDTGSNYTFFAPTNEAVSAAMSTLDQATSDEKALTKAVQAHILPQTTYSTNITDGMTSATLNGDNMKFSVNDTGIFITSNGHEAQVVGSDYIASNGVVHLINAVLLNSTSSSSASGSASGSGSAASSASQTASSASSSASSA